ncbi:MAG: GSCFA domain-containing protein [Rikenellaceae bacterium]|nr:GSCFA domain-containing protein [Rikenellaceae bacterium]MCL2692318.1 GSCFA domain-containing protein [Rikenellaceae bacterium]
MEFRTRVNIAPFERKIGHTQSGLSLGSCFATNVAAHMRRAKLRVADNPFGVLFNPLSVANALERLADGREFGRDDLVWNGDMWCNFSLHGSFSSPCAEEALYSMNRAVRDGAQQLESADYVIITFGTAWVYERNGAVVANCHKLPAAEFVRRRLAVEEIVARYDALFTSSALRGKHIILTVSPVRHTKDGLAENSLSKAVLIEAVHALSERHATADYFPAFEIVCDELRDYRFYAADMVHPSEVAVQYIWERFAKAALTERARDAAKAAESVVTAVEHRPLHPAAASHTTFRAAILNRIVTLAERYPEIDFSEEIRYFST